jgi:predicted nucleic-acid-binding Zn-ribbon protein
MSKDKTEKEKIDAKVLDTKRRQKVTEHINEKALSDDDGCPVCGSSRSVVAESEYSVPVNSNSNAYILSGQHMPAYATICANCGYVRFFSKRVVDRITGLEE